MNYQFSAPQKIVFGWGQRSVLGALAESLGRRAFVVCGSRTLAAQGRCDEIRSLLDAKGIGSTCFQVESREPEVRDVDELTTRIRDHQPGDGDLIIAVGGGSTIDLAKAAAGLAPNNPAWTICDYLEGVGLGRKLKQDPLPMIAIPTTAGTGSEVTKNAVVTSYAPPFKKSFRDERLIPKIVLVDPELTTSVPKDVTTWSGLDAITQLVESYLSCRAAPIPQALSVAGLRLALPALPVAVNDGQNREAREAMSHAALLSGLALANSGLGLAHGVAAALGSQCRIPHGLACAVMLVPMLKFNHPHAAKQMAQLARDANVVEPGKSDAECAAALISEIESLCRRLNLPIRLRDLGVKQSDLDPLLPASKGNSLSGNPRPVNPEELDTLLKELW